MLSLLLLGAATGALLWKWLDFRSFSELSTRLSNVFGRRDQHLFSNLFQVDEKSERHGGELVAAVLKAHDVQEIFTLCGGHISPILVASEKLGIKIIDTRHEVTAVFAADAVARLRQSIGVAAVTAGPGVTNTITAIKNAQMAESPILLIGGAAPTLLKGRGALQDIDQLVLFRPLCKYAARVSRLRDIVPTLRQAIKAATEGTPGPVFVEFPVDVLYPYALVVKEIGFNPNAKGFIQTALNTYLRAHVSRQFSAAWLPQELAPIPATIPLPTDSQALGIPVYLGGMARGLLGKDCPLQMRQNRRDALKNADLTILAGTVCDFRLSYGRVLSKKSKIVTINRNANQLTKNEKAFWNSDLSIQADVASTIVGASKLVKNTATQFSSWTEELRVSEEEKESANAKKALQPTADGHLNPLKFLQELDKSLPEDTILVADGGDFVGSAAYIVRPRGPLQWLDPGAFGTLGVGGGFALGAKAVYPNRPVVILWGDGSCGYSLMEFDTFTRHRLAVTAIVGNDACWSQIAREQIPMFKSRVAVDLARTPYCEVATAMGALGVTLSKDSTQSTKEIMEKAFLENKRGQSALVNVHIGTTDFREGSISV